MSSGCNIFACFKVAHHYLRQSEINKSGNLGKSVGDELAFKHHGETYKAKKTTVLDAAKRAATKVGFTFDKTAIGPQGWLAIAKPYVAIFGAYKLRSKEVRVGASSFKICVHSHWRETYTITSQLGLTPAHHAFMESITFTPSSKSSMPLSMGIFTNIYQL